MWEITGKQGRRLRNPAESRDAAWSDERCIVSWALKGLLSNTSPTAFGGSRGSGRPSEGVTCVQASPGEAASVSIPARLVCGDGEGTLLLMRYPSSGGGELGWQGKGHVGTIKDVCFGERGWSAVSVGRQDACVLQWKIVKSDETFAAVRAASLDSGTVYDSTRVGQGEHDPRAGGVTRMDSMTAEHDELIELGKVQVQLLKELIARRNWEDAFLSLKEAIDIFGRTPVKEEWSWNLLKRAHLIQDGSVQDAAVLLDEIRVLVAKGDISSSGAPADKKLEMATKLFRFAKEAPIICGAGERIGEPDLLKSADTVLSGTPATPLLPLLELALPLRARLKIPILFTACECDIWVVAERIGKAEKHLEDASKQGRESSGWLQQAVAICKKAGHVGDASVIHQLQELHGKVSATMVYFQEHLSAAKELYREDWFSSKQGRVQCEQMESADGRSLRCVGLNPKF